MVFVKQMLFVFQKAEKRCHRSYGIQMTAPFWVVSEDYSSRFGPILCTPVNFQQHLNPMVSVKHMFLEFRKVQKRCNRSYGIQMTASFLAVFVGYITPFRANFMLLVQFSGTAKPDDFCEPHVVGVQFSGSTTIGATDFK